MNVCANLVHSRLLEYGLGEVAVEDEASSHDLLSIVPQLECRRISVHILMMLDLLTKNIMTAKSNREQTYDHFTVISNLCLNIDHTAISHEHS